MQTFRRCKRKWHFDKTSGLPRESTPAQRRGTAIHAALELYLKNGTILGGVEIDATTGNATGIVSSDKVKEGLRDNGCEWWQTERYVRAAMKYLPAPPPHGPPTLLEEAMYLPTRAGVPWIGFIDLIEETPAKITDHKTTSDIRRYAKKPAELITDVQAISYARYLFEASDELVEVIVRLLYFETRNKLRVNTLSVEVTLSREYVAEQWEIIEGEVEEMVRLYQVENTLELEPNTAACGDYGGCPYSAKCGLNQIKSIFQENTVGFLSKMTKKVAEIEEEGVLPKDAPSRETSAEEAEEITKSKKKTPKKKAPKKTAPPPEAETEAEETAPEPKEEPKRGRPKKSRLTIYIDCSPVGVECTLFENWVAPVLAALNEECAKEMEVPSFWLLPFGEQKAALATALAAAAKGLTGDLVVSSSDPHTREALPHLIPLADLVVRGNR